jgi:hypothetical protein
MGVIVGTDPADPFHALICMTGPGALTCSCGRLLRRCPVCERTDRHAEDCEHEDAKHARRR